MPTCGSCGAVPLLHPQDETGLSTTSRGHPHFDPAEFSGRIDALRNRMRKAGVDVALFDEIEAMTWLSGFGNTENRWRCVGIPLEGEPFFLIRALDANPCRQRSWITDVPTFRDWEDPMVVLASALDRRGLRRATIGLDFGSYGMPLSRFARMKEALPGARFVDLGNVVWELRLSKSPAEMELLRRAASVADGPWSAPPRPACGAPRNGMRPGRRGRVRGTRGGSGSARPDFRRPWMGLPSRPSRTIHHWPRATWCTSN